MPRRITGGTTTTTFLADIFAYVTVASPTYTAAAGELLWLNTSSNAITVTLPGNPQEGDTIRFVDVAKTFDSNALTVNRNGRLIQGDAENLTVNTESASFELVYYNSVYGWRIFSI
jgi:hypothetical protein